MCYCLKYIKTLNQIDLSYLIRLIPLKWSGDNFSICVGAALRWFFISLYPST